MSTPNPDVVAAENTAAEAALLGAAMSIPGALGEARRYMRDDDFYLPAHQVVWDVIVGLADGGAAYGAMQVLTALRKERKLTKAGGATQLFDMVQRAMLGSPSWLAERIHDAAMARRIQQVGVRLQQIATNPDDMDTLLDQTARQLLAAELIVDERLSSAPLTDLHRVDEFYTSRPSLQMNWLVHEVMTRADVWFVLAGEGGGKSWLSRQFVLCLASGIHPFRPAMLQAPMRTLLCDFENDPDMLAYELRLMDRQLSSVSPVLHENARLWPYPKGLNLRERESQVLFERHLEAARPDFVAMGSLFKTFRRGRDDWDTAAEEVRDFLDRMRFRYHFSLMVEHHMGKANRSESASPYGAITWQQWPSLGHVLRRVGNNAWSFEAYRGTRLVRDLPFGMYRGGELPWSPIWDQEELKAVSWQRHRARPE